MIAARDASDGVRFRPHPRRIGWIGTTALAMGGSNQSLFLISALFAGQGDIPGQGSAAVPLLVVSLLLSYAAAPGWTELVLRFLAVGMDDYLAKPVDRGRVAQVLGRWAGRL